MTFDKLTKRIEKISDKLNKKVQNIEEVCRLNGVNFEKEAVYISLELMKIEKLVDEM